jgi:tRNA(Arg) A34 adenosine deaminase TadA
VSPAPAGAPTEAELLGRAVALAAGNAAAGQLPFGALVVREGRVLADGVNTALDDSDPTAHAETAAIRAACKRLGTLELPGSTLVSSCEPCPMCQAVAVLVGVSRIVYAATKEDADRAGFVLPPLAAEAHAFWRSAAARLVEHVPTEGSYEPFARFAEGQSSG